ncbi:MAG: hypothetical protein RL885_23890 [Planctomycetota bacterium]
MKLLQGLRTVSLLATGLLVLSMSTSCRRESGDIILVSDQASVQDPTADAGPDLTAGYGKVVVLDGSRSKSGNPAEPGLSFRWEQLSGPSINLQGENSVRASFAAPLRDTAFTFRLTVLEAERVSSPDEVSVEIRNAAPIADAGPDIVVDPGLPASLDGTGSSDPDGGPGPLEFSWMQTGGQTTPPLDGADTATPVLVPEFGRDQLTFEVVVNDGVTFSTPDSVVVDVDIQPLGNAGPNQEVGRGAQVVLDATASDDPDGDPLTYEWIVPESVTLSPDRFSPIATFRTDSSQDLEYPIELRVFDEVREGVRSFLRVHSVSSPGTRPLADAGRTQMATPGTEVALVAFDSLDPDTELQDLTFTWTPDDEELDLSSTSSPTPTFVAPDEAPQVQSFTLVVSDGSKSSTDRVSVLIAPSDNVAPSVSAGEDQIVEPGAPVQLAGTVDDADGPDQPTFQWRQLEGEPVLLDDPSRLDPSFTAPSDLAFRTMRFRLVAWDGLQYSVADDVMVTISSPDAPIAIAEACDPADASDYRPLEDVCLDASRSFDPNGFPILAFRWTEPEGFGGTLDDPNVEIPIATLPNVHRDLIYTLEVSNGAQWSDPTTVSLTVVNRAPTAAIQGEPGAAVQPNSQVTIDSLLSTDPDGSVLASRWQQISGAETLAFNADQPSIVFRPKQAALPGFTLRPPIVLQLTVDDGNLDEVDHTDTVNSQPILVNPSHEHDVAEFLRDGCDGGRCTSCHSTTGNAGGFSISCDDIDALFRELTIELSPTEQNPRVDVTDPENSLLLRKMRATDGNHDDLYPESSEEYRLILEWIRSGALKN